MAYGDLSGTLAGMLPGLSPFLADTFINNAWRKIRDRRQWSFLVNDASIVCPAQITSGTFAINQFSASVIGNSAARTALLAVNVGLGAGLLSLVKLQIRFQTSTAAAQSYNILTAVDTNPTITLTLDRPVQESTNALSSYIVYRQYIIPPATDFESFQSLDDLPNAIRIVGPRLTYSSTYFDIRDPQRQAFGLSYFLGFYNPNPATGSNSSPMFELWPGSTNGQTFYVRYRRRGVAFALPSDTQPDLIPDDLILDVALLHWAYPHCQANIGHFPAMRNVNWTALIAEKQLHVYGDLKRGIGGSLMAAIRHDDAQYQSSVLNRGHGLKDGRPNGFWGPIDSNYIQSHPITW